jgi:glucose-6-phosphate isomerase
MEEWCSVENIVENPAAMFAVLQFLNETRFDRRISVMMPYSSRLRDLADWYRQLWAESLGKAVDRTGKTVHTGMTPVKALGATDQHSQVQLYSEGPDDKLITFLRVERFEHDVRIPDSHPDEPDLAYLADHSFGDLLNAEQVATAWALARRRRPSLTISVPRVDAPSLGQLFYLLEVATAVMGELHGIDAFDQPGVELGKQATYALMGRGGHEALAGEIRATAGGDSLYVMR